MSTYGSIVLEVANDVHVTDKYVPLTGVYSVEEQANGWRWDRRQLPSVGFDSTRYLTYLGGHEDGLLDGTQLQHWQSGVLNGIEYNDIVKIPDGDQLQWVPRYSTGDFTVYWDTRPLYSDYSYSEIAGTEIGGHRQVALRSDSVHNSITATLYKRLPGYEIVAVHDIALVDEFTGVLDGGVRVSAQSGDVIDWSNVETRKKEMTIVGDNLVFNQSFSMIVGGSDVDKDIVESSWENKGKGLTAGRPLFCKYFPLKSGTVKLVSVSTSGVLREWTLAQTLNFSSATDLHFSVNHDLGTIQTGGYKAPSLVLGGAVSLNDTEISIVADDNMEFFSEQGVIVVDGEQIYYTARTRTAFLDCIRGWNGTTVAEHAKGLVVDDIQHGASTTDKWYVSYEAAPKVEYEITSHDLRTANYNSWLDVRALSNIKANNIVQIVSQDTNLSEIVLTTDSEPIGGNLFGPVFYGTDTSRLTATGLDAAGNPVEDIDLSIYIKSGVGSLNGTLKTYTAESNSLGQVSCFYNAPYSLINTDMEVLSVAHVGSDTHMTVNISTAVTPSEVWVFQILKHDPVLGTVGDFVNAFAGGSATDPNGFGYVDVWMPYVEDYNGGTLLLQDVSGVRRSLPIRWAEKQVDGSGEPYVRFFVEQSVDPAWLAADSKAWLFQSDAVEWNESKKRGARVILYEFSNEAQQPTTGVAGAYTPVHPDSIQGNVLVFSNRLLPIPDPADREVNLGAYVIVAPAEVRCSAYGRDPFTGSLITSNDVRLRLQLPNTLTGVDDSGVLPIPYGWTLITEEFNIGAGLDGANFITINPAATGINQFSLTGVI